MFPSSPPPPPQPLFAVWACCNALIVDFVVCAFPALTVVYVAVQGTVLEEEEGEEDGDGGDVTRSPSSPATSTAAAAASGPETRKATAVAAVSVSPLRLPSIGTGTGTGGQKAKTFVRQQSFGGSPLLHANPPSNPCTRINGRTIDRSIC